MKEEPAFDMRIPGQKPVPAKPQSKVLIQEVKKTPTCTTQYNADGRVCTGTVYMSRKESAKDLIVDVSARCLKLTSEQ